MFFIEKIISLESLSFFFTKTLYISEYTDLDKLVDRLAIYNQFESWQYCGNCHILATNKMLPNFGNQKIQHNTNCNCKHDRYSIILFIIALFLYLTVNIYLPMTLSLICAKLHQGSDYI